MAEDSSFEGWTSSGSTLGLVPEGRKLPGGPAKGYVGEVRSLPRATPDAIKFASRSWPQGRAEDFDRDGREFVDRATGARYRIAPGNPLLSEHVDVADVFVVIDDSLMFLRLVDRPVARSTYLGSVTV